ncbi:MAG: rod-binding protein [Paracoccaceae bacterium]|jgi:flagellar protein FlgJ|nr:rod-binding protein [Alphaproteobacteria bacterium]
MDNIVPVTGNLLSPELVQRQSAPEDLRAAAEQFEAIFIQTLLKQARQSKLADDILGSSAGDNYIEMLEQERAKSMAQNMNLGIAEALVKQFGLGVASPPKND